MRRRLRVSRNCLRLVGITSIIVIAFLIASLLTVQYTSIIDVDLKEYLSNINSNIKSLTQPSPIITVSDAPVSHNYSREAYATLLTPGDPHPWTEGRPDFYFESCKILIHRLLHHEPTRDPHNRPVIVLVTPSVLQKQIDVLRSFGAEVRVVEKLDPPRGTVDFDNINPRYRDQFTKLHMWNMTEFERIAYFDSDALIIRPVHDIFDVPSRLKGREEWLFAAVYDSGALRREGIVMEPGPEDKGGRSDLLSAGMFLLMPTTTQSEYIFNMFRHPPKKDFTTFMEQDLLRWAYRDQGRYPWVRLSHLYNTQWCVDEDLETAYVIHDKLWNRGIGTPLREIWYEALGDMIGWEMGRHNEGEYLLPHGI